jgi:hypothetical protein
MPEDSITRIFKFGRVVWQRYIDGEVPELPVIIHIDNGDSIIISQEGRDVILNPDTLPDFIKAIKQAEKSRREKQ